MSEQEPNPAPEKIEPYLKTYTFSSSEIREILLEAAKTKLAVDMDDNEQEYQVLHEQVENRAGGDKLVHLMIRNDEDVYGE